MRYERLVEKPRNEGSFIAVAAALMRGRVPSFCATGVDQAERAAARGLTDRVECAAAASSGLLRARVGTCGTLNQRGRAAVRQEQRRAAAATAQRSARADGQHGAYNPREERETPVHFKPRSHLVFRSRDCATQLLRCVTRCKRRFLTRHTSMPYAAIFL